MKPITKLPVRPCPCGSKKTLQSCCGPFIEGASAPTAEALMRSRYTAYALKHEPYLIESWHSSTRPESIDFSPTLRWTGLEIRGTADHGAEATVEFIARFREHGRPGALHETSRFVQEGGRWLYVDGTVQS